MTLLLVLLAFALLELSCLLLPERQYLPGQSLQLTAATIWPYALLILSASEGLYCARSLDPLILAAGTGRISLCIAKFSVLALFFALTALLVTAAAAATACLARNCALPTALWAATAGLFFLFTLPCLGLGMLCAVVFSSRTAACTVAVGSYMIVDLTKNRLGLDAYFFSSLADKPFTPLHDAAMELAPQWPEALHFLLALAWLALPLGLTVLIFSRKDLP